MKLSRRSMGRFMAAPILMSTMHAAPLDVQKKTLLPEMSTSTLYKPYMEGGIMAPCESMIFCRGELLEAIQLSGHFNDSKQFVDMSTKKSERDVLDDFNRRKPLTKANIGSFLKDNFRESGSELRNVTGARPCSSCNGTDFYLNHVQNPTVRYFAWIVSGYWPQLAREYVKDDCSECVSSFLPMMHSPFIVAGGRFREPYYWDSFWIIEGLLRSGGDWQEVAKNMILNFLDFVEQYGMVPNGARAYYLNRSQPPMLTQMVELYLKFCEDEGSMLEEALPLLVKEYEWWQEKRHKTLILDDGPHNLAFYDVSNNQPRPESYKEDFQTAHNLTYFAQNGSTLNDSKAKNFSDGDRDSLYKNIASAAETGIDFSSRWLSKPEHAYHRDYLPLRTIMTSHIIPVDLNSIMYANEMTISKFYSVYKRNLSEADRWSGLARKRANSMHKLLWNETHGTFFDYDWTTQTHRLITVADENASLNETFGAPNGTQFLFSPTQLFPFWTGALNDSLQGRPDIVRKAYSLVEYFLDTKDGGIPASNLESNQQWDEPNVWPPFQYALAQGLLNTKHKPGVDDEDYQWTQKLALRVAQRYVDATFCTWRSWGGVIDILTPVNNTHPNFQGVMFEKYSSDSIWRTGSGGEYDVVEGFGWTNGILLWAADEFGENLTEPKCGEILPARPFVVPA